MLMQAQVIIGVIAAVFAIVVAISAAAVLVIANFVQSWPDEFFGNFLGAATLISMGFGVAEGFLALTRYVSGS